MKLDDLRARLREPEEPDLDLIGIETQCPECLTVNDCARTDFAKGMVRVKCRSCGLDVEHSPERTHPLGYFAELCGSCGHARSGHVVGRAGCFATIHCECREFVHAWNYAP